MKTKRTSDALVIERSCKSTLPFCLDDPKTVEAIGELLIDLCNGGGMANMKSGMQAARSIPIICANFTSNASLASLRWMYVPMTISSTCNN